MINPQLGERVIDMRRASGQKKGTVLGINSDRSVTVAWDCQLERVKVGDVNSAGNHAGRSVVTGIMENAD